MHHKDNQPDKYLYAKPLSKDIPTPNPKNSA